MPLKAALQQLDAWLREQGLIGQVGGLGNTVQGAPHCKAPYWLLAKSTRLFFLLCPTSCAPHLRAAKACGRCSLRSQPAPRCSASLSRYISVPSWRLLARWFAGQDIQPADVARLGPESDDGIRVQVSEAQGGLFCVRVCVHTCLWRVGWAAKSLQARR